MLTNERGHWLYSARCEPTKGKVHCANRLTSLWIRYLLLCVIVATSADPVAAQSYCQTNHGNRVTAQVPASVSDTCNCQIIFYNEQCQSGTCGGSCYNLRKQVIDGGEGNCVFLCCELNEWDCINCPGTGSASFSSDRKCSRG
jgi:hypothetical protein